MLRKKPFETCKKCLRRNVALRTHCFQCHNHHKKTEFCMMSVKKTLETSNKTNIDLNASSDNSLNSLSSIDYSYQFTNSNNNANNTENVNLLPKNTNNNTIKFYYDNYSSLFLPIKSNNIIHSQWHKIFANINNYHLINPPGYGDCLFYIISQISLLNNWNNIPFP